MHPNKPYDDKQSLSIISKEVYVIILDANPSDWWTPRAPLPTGSMTSAQCPSDEMGHRLPLNFTDMWIGLSHFLDVIALGWPKIMLAVYCIDCNDACMLFKGNIGELVNLDLLSAVIKQMKSATVKGKSHGDSLLSVALSNAICFLYVEKEGRSNFKGSILVIDAAPPMSYSTQCSNLMNSAFAAHHQKININVCSVGIDKPPAVCHQLSTLTEGTALTFSEVSTAIAKVETPSNFKLPSLGFGAFLVFHFTSSAIMAATRSSSSQHHQFSPQTAPKLTSTHTWPLVPAAASTISSSAVCICHLRSLDVVLVCTSCLTVYCHEFDGRICSVCGAEFHEDDSLTIADLTFPLRNASKP